MCAFYYVIGQLRLEFKPAQPTLFMTFSTPLDCLLLRGVWLHNMWKIGEIIWGIACPGRHEPPLGCVLIAYPAVCEPYLVNQFLVRLNKSPFHFSYVFSYHCESKWFDTFGRRVRGDGNLTTCKHFYCIFAITPDSKKNIWTPHPKGHSNYGCVRLVIENRIAAFFLNINARVFFQLGFAETIFLASQGGFIDVPNNYAPIFHRPILNLGDHFDPTTAKYTVPLDGIYQFTIHIQTKDISRIAAYIEIDDRFVSTSSKTTCA